MNPIHSLAVKEGMTAVQSIEDELSVRNLDTVIAVPDHAGELVQQ